jgi:hypothetical protein
MGRLPNAAEEVEFETVWDIFPAFGFEVEPLWRYGGLVLSQPIP